MPHIPPPQPAIISQSWLNKQPGTLTEFIAALNLNKETAKCPRCVPAAAVKRLFLILSKIQEPSQLIATTNFLFHTRHNHSKTYQDVPPENPNVLPENPDNTTPPLNTETIELIHNKLLAETAQDRARLVHEIMRIRWGYDGSRCHNVRSTGRCLSCVTAAIEKTFGLPHNYLDGLNHTGFGYNVPNEIKTFFGVWANDLLKGPRIHNSHQALDEIPDAILDKIQNGDSLLQTDHLNLGIFNLGNGLLFVNITKEYGGGPDRKPIYTSPLGSIVMISSSRRRFTHIQITIGNSKAQSDFTLTGSNSHLAPGGFVGFLLDVNRYQHALKILKKDLDPTGHSQDNTPAGYVVGIAVPGGDNAEPKKIFMLYFNATAFQKRVPQNVRNILPTFEDRLRKRILRQIQQKSNKIENTGTLASIN